MPSAAHFDQAGERRRRAHQEPTVARFDMHAVVRHQPREGSASRAVQELPGQSRFAGPDGPRISAA